MYIIYNYVAEKLHNKKIHRPQEFGLSRSGKSLWYFNPEQSKKLTYLFTREKDINCKVAVYAYKTVYLLYTSH